MGDQLKVPTLAPCQKARTFRGAITGLVLAAVTCVLVTVSAQAAHAAVPGSSYGYVGELSSVSGSEPVSAVAVSKESGNIFLVSPGEFSVKIFDSNEAPTAEAPLFEPTLAQPLAIAASPDGNTFYIQNGLSVFGLPLIAKYTSNGTSPLSYGFDSTWTPALPEGELQIGGLALDPSNEDVLLSLLPSTGEKREVLRLDGTTGAQISEIESSGVTGSSFFPSALAAAPNGDVYVVNSEPARIEHFGPDGSFKGILPLIEPHPENSVYPDAIAVNPLTGEVATTQSVRPNYFNQEPVIAIYSADGQLKEIVLMPVSVPIEENAIDGLAYSSDGSKLYLTRSNGGALIFRRGTQPGLDAPIASQIQPTAALLTGTVATGLQSTDAHLEYCLASEPCTKYLNHQGGSPWRSLPDHTEILGDEEEISDEVTGLQPNTRYLARAYAINEKTNVQNLSPTTEFKTAVVPPAVETIAASDVSDASAIMNGTIETFGDPTAYCFEYGTTASYGSRVPVATDTNVGTDRARRSVAQEVTGLQPGVTYHYRIVAVNSAGQAFGADRTFTTLVQSQLPPSRVYEQVTPADKHGVAINIGHMEAASDGDTLSYTANAGPRSSPLFTVAISTREATDWHGPTYTDLPINVGTGNGGTGFIFNQSTLAISDDFHHAFVVSNRALTQDATPGTSGMANLYVENLVSGALEFVGATTSPSGLAAFTGPQTSGNYLAGASDFQWIVFGSTPSLLPGAPEGAIYRWSKAGGLKVVSLLPNGDPTAAIRGNQFTGSYNVVSDDGTRMFYSAVKGTEEGVFLREGEGSAVPISVSHIAGDPSTPHKAVLLAVSRNGRYAFFTCSTRLVETAPGETGDLYRYDSANGVLEYLGAQATAQLASTIEGVRINRGAMASAPDGSTLYFNATTSTGGIGPLTVWHEGSIKTIKSSPLVEARFGRSSPDGRYFAFRSGPEGATGPTGPVEIYDAVTQELTCASCLADGTPAGAALAGYDEELSLSNRLPQVVDDSGTVYFETSARLSARDVNGLTDVYDFSHGTVTLISPGDGPFEAHFGDISEDGSDVFFTTAEKLVGRDDDEAVDIYDARVNGGLPAQSPVVQSNCTSLCKNAPKVSAVSAAGSEALRGPGSVKPIKSKKRSRACARGKRKPKVKGAPKCVKAHHRAKQRGDRAAAHRKGGVR